MDALGMEAVDRLLIAMVQMIWRVDISSMRSGFAAIYKEPRSCSCQSKTYVTGPDRSPNALSDCHSNSAVNGVAKGWDHPHPLRFLGRAI